MANEPEKKPEPAASDSSLSSLQVFSKLLEWLRNVSSTGSHGSHTKVNDIIEEMKKGMFNILVAGRSGAGKSTLVNKVFEGNLAETGSSEPVTMETLKYTKKDVPLTVYDTRGLELAEYKKIFDELLAFVEKNQKEELSQRIHVAWICIVEDYARVEDAEKMLVQKLAKFMPVIVVITKAKTRAGQKFQSEARKLLPEVKNIVRVRAIKEVLDAGHVLQPEGLENLMEATAQVLPDGGEALRAYIRVQKSIKLKKAEADKIISAAVVTSVGTTVAIPVPLVSETLLIPIQMAMLTAISTIFGVTAPSPEFWRNLATGLATSLAGSTLVVRGIGHILKIIPGVGTLLGGAILGSSSALLTHSIGYWYRDFLVKRITGSGGKLPSLDEIIQGFTEFSATIQKKANVVKTE